MRAPLRLVVLVLAVATLALAAPLPPAAATAGAIQPGDVVTSSEGQCTLNFVFDGVGVNAGKVYLGTAAHCVAKVGDEVSSSPYSDFARVAFIGDAGDIAKDFAFLEVKPDFLHLVDPRVKGHPAYPTGWTARGEAKLGDKVQLSGYGLGFGVTKATQESRQGLFTGDNPSTWRATGPAHWGDSGGPLLHADSGKAIGVVTHLCTGVCSIQGPTLDNVLRRAADAGFPVELRTVS